MIKGLRLGAAEGTTMWLVSGVALSLFVEGILVNLIEFALTGALVGLLWDSLLPATVQEYDVVERAEGSGQTLAEMGLREKALRGLI